MLTAQQDYNPVPEKFLIFSPRGIVYSFLSNSLSKSWRLLPVNHTAWEFPLQRNKILNHSKTQKNHRTTRFPQMCYLRKYIH